MIDRPLGLFFTAVRVLTVSVALVGLSDLAASEEPGPRSPEIALLGDREQKRVVLEVEVDGKSLLTAWDEAMAALFRHCDRNGDAILDETEAQSLPSPFGLRQLSWGIFRLDGPAPPWPQIDANHDAKLNAVELSTFYRSRGLGPVLVGIGQPSFTDRLNETLVGALDADHDGRVQAKEFQQAEKLLEKLDRNGDERLTAEELVPGHSYPGTRGTLRLASLPAAQPAADAAEFPLLLLPSWDDGGRWAEGVARRPGFSLDARELVAWRGEAATDPWTVRLGRSQDGSPAPRREQSSYELTPDAAWLTAAADGLEFHLRADEGTQSAGFQAHRKQLNALFTTADVDLDGHVSAKELEDPSYALLALVVPWADRDGDGALSRAERDSWFGLLEDLARGSVLITVLDHGRGLFEVIDSDHDGSLSTRELRECGKLVEKAGALVEDALNLDRLPRTLIGCLSRGHPRIALAARTPAHPDWFQGMDRNRDGDISVSEWFGDRTLFHKLDLDHDNLLSPGEAMR